MARPTAAAKRHSTRLPAGKRPATLGAVTTSQLGLFAPTTLKSVEPAAAEAWAQLAGQLPPSLRMGTSSWSFPGWNELVYAAKYDKTQLAREGLVAYSAHPLLRAVGLDRTFYRPESAESFNALAEQTPDDFRFVVKAPRALTTPRMRDTGGRMQDNPIFLDAEFAREAVAAPTLAGLGDKLGVLLLQFPPFGPQEVGGARHFAEQLSAVLATLPTSITWAVELRNRGLFTPRYVRALRGAGALHCYVHHPSMPPLEHQLEAVPVEHARVTLVRWMLRREMTYEQARDRFSPFGALVAPDGPTREAVATLCRRAAARAQPTFVIVNNKAEGSAPLSIQALAETLVANPGRAEQKVMTPT